MNSEGSGQTGEDVQADLRFCFAPAFLSHIMRKPAFCFAADQRICFCYTDILRGTRNFSFVLRRSLLITFETIWIFVITLECSNLTALKSIRRERKMRPMELSGVNFSTHGSESECSCFDQILCIRV